MKIKMECGMPFRYVPQKELSTLIKAIEALDHWPDKKEMEKIAKDMDKPVIWVARMTKHVRMQYALHRYFEEMCEESEEIKTDDVSDV